MQMQAFAGHRAELSGGKVQILRQKLRDAGFAKAVAGVQVNGVVEDQNPPRLEYDPGHPDANADGYVAYPNVNPVEEMVDMITTQRAYEMNSKVIQSADQMLQRLTQLR